MMFFKLLVVGLLVFVVWDLLIKSHPQIQKKRLQKMIDNYMFLNNKREHIAKCIERAYLIKHVHVVATNGEVQHNGKFLGKIIWNNTSKNFIFQPYGKELTHCLIITSSGYKFVEFFERQGK